MSTKTCVQCEKTFEAKRNHRLLCSQQCRNAKSLTGQATLTPHKGWADRRIRIASAIETAHKLSLCCEDAKLSARLVNLAQRAQSRLGRNNIPGVHELLKEGARLEQESAHTLGWFAALSLLCAVCSARELMQEGFITDGHEQRNAAFVSSLKTEIAAKKERKDERVQTTERDAPPVATPAPTDCVSQDQREVDRAAPAQLRTLYWDAILSRDPGQIREAVRAARGAGLRDLLETTKRQLTNDLAEPHRAARAEAVAEWERDG